MTIKKETHEVLFTFFEISKRLKKGELTIGMVVMNHLQTCFEHEKNALSDFIRDFCEYNGVEEGTEESVKAFLAFNQTVFSRMFKELNVEIVSDSFFDCLNGTNLDSALNKVSLYKEFGECAGTLLFPDGVMQYAITSEGALFRYFPNTGTKFYYSYDFDDVDFKKYSAVEDIYNPYFCQTLKVLMIKKYGEVETTLVGKGVRRVFEDEVVVNRTPFPVHRLDSSWFKTVVRTEGFLVRGFWRLQPYGKGRKERRLTYIQPFMKHGYVRKAPALIARAST